MDKNINHKLEKAKAIANEISQLAEIMAKSACVAFPPKRLFRKKGKRPLKRLQRQRALMALGLAPGMTRMRIAMIVAQPIPKYPPGTATPGGIAIVGESGHELILTPNGTFTTSNQHPHPNQLPSGPIRPVPGIGEESDV